MEVYESKIYMDMDGLNIIDVKDLEVGLYQISGALQCLSPYTLNINGVLEYVDDFTKTIFINFEGGDFNISVLEPVELTYISLVLSRWE